MNAMSPLVVTLALAALGVPAATARAQSSDGAADLILTGGQVRSPTGWADALAVRGELIVAVGDAAAVARLRGPRTKVIPLAGWTVLPGLHDTHVHPIHGGITARRCRIPQGSSLAEALRLVKGCVARAAPGEWILGGQWDVRTLGGVPDRRSLDGVAPNNPVLLDDTSGHSAWANSAALAAAEVTKETKDPTGGIIERDAAGAPTGVLREFAIELVRGRAPAPSQRQIESALAWASAQMLAVGLTSFTEASLGFMGGAERELAAYAALADRGLLKQRVT